MICKISKLALVAAISVASLSAAYEVEITKVEDEKSPFNEFFRVKVEDSLFKSTWFRPENSIWCYIDEKSMAAQVLYLRLLVTYVEKVSPKCNLPLVLEAKKLLESCEDGVTSENIVNAPKALQLLRDALGDVDINSTYGDHVYGEVTYLSEPYYYFSSCISHFSFFVRDHEFMKAAISEDDVSIVEDLVKRAMKAISIPVVRDTLEEAKKKFSGDFFTSISKDNAGVCLAMVKPFLELESAAREFLTEEEIKRASSTENLSFRLQCKFDLDIGGEDLGLDSTFRKHKDYAIRAMKDLIDEEANRKELVDGGEEPLKYTIIFVRNVLDILEERGSFS